MGIGMAIMLVLQQLGDA